MCICEAADVWDTFHQHMVSSTRNMRRYSEHYSVELHNQLMDEVAFLQQIRSGAKLEPDAAVAPVKHQDLANHVTGSIEKHSTKLQQSFTTAIDGYDKYSTGDCRLYIFFAPHQAKVRALNGNEGRDSKTVPSYIQGTDSHRPASKKPSTGWQPRSAGWLALVTFTAGFVVGAVSCNTRKSSHSH